MDAVRHEAGSNRLARAAMATPAGMGRWLSIGGRAAGAGLAVVVAVDQSYTRTRTLAVAVAVVALATFMPLPAGLAGRLAWLGAGLLFFGGALVAHVAPGRLMLLGGALAALGAAIDDQHAGRMTGVAWFFTGAGVVVALVAAIVLGIEG